MEWVAAKDSLNGQRWLLAYCMAVFVLNDLLFWLLKESYAIYLADYALRLLMLFPLLVLWKTLPPGPPRRMPGWSFPLLWLGLVVFSQAIEPLSVFLGRGWHLFSWPQIENMWLWLFDLSFGLILVASVEEMVDRRLALAVLPGPVWVPSDRLQLAFRADALGSGLRPHGGDGGLRAGLWAGLSLDGIA